MACMTHECRDCGQVWEDNARASTCRRCGSFGVSNEFDEAPADERDVSGYEEPDADPDEFDHPAEED